MSLTAPPNASGLTRIAYCLNQTCRALSLVGIAWSWIMPAVALFIGGPLMALLCMAIFTTLVLAAIYQFATGNIDTIRCDHGTQ